MKIWFDISNSPHVIMFCDLIKHLEADGHEVLITSRPLANTIALLDQYHLPHTPVGAHYGKRFIHKILGYPIRVLQLYYHLKNQKPDLAISQSSFHSPVVAKLLGIPSVYTNDNEHALGNYPAFLSATRVLLPEALTIPKLFSYHYFQHKFIRYPGIKEGIYLWKRAKFIMNRRTAFVSSRQHIFIRPEPTTAQYYNGKLNFLDDLIISLQDDADITILTRDDKQFSYYRSHPTIKVDVPESPMSFEDIAIRCTVFIGAGGSMTRELAAIGIPSISVYQSELLQVDHRLIEKGLLIHDPDLTADKVKQYTKILQYNTQNEVVMKDGEKAYSIFLSTISDLLSVHNSPDSFKKFQISKF